MPPQRTLDDITAGELADLEVARPELFNDPHWLAQHLDLVQSEIPELIDLLETSGAVVATINRIVHRPVRPVNLVGSTIYPAWRTHDAAPGRAQVALQRRLERVRAEAKRLGLVARPEAEWQRLDAHNAAQMQAYAAAHKLVLVDEAERGLTLSEYGKMQKEQLTALQQMIREESSEVARVNAGNLANEVATTRQALSEGMRALEEKLVDKEPKPKSLPARDALRAAIRKHGYPRRGGSHWKDVMKTSEGWSVETTPMSLSTAKRWANKFFPEGTQRR